MKLMMNENLEETADKMLQAALQGGGKDNISIVLIQDNTVFQTDNTKESIQGNSDDGQSPEEVKPQ